MKELFGYLIKLLPQPVVIAIVLIACAFFAIYYQFSYRSYSDAFRDSKFRTIAVVGFAAALLYIINAPKLAQDSPHTKPVLLVPQFANDNDDTYRIPFVSEIAVRLDATLSRAGTVERIRAFVGDPEAARQTMTLYGASAILFDTSVSHIGDQHILCMKLLTSGSQVTACFPPLQFTERHKQVDNIVVAIAGHVATSDQTNAYPLIKRIASLEAQVNRLASLVQAGSLQAPSTRYPNYRKRYAVIVGIDKVSGLTHSLRFSKTDAEAVARVLRDKYDFQTRVLLDQVATKGGILTAISDVSTEATKDDLFVFFFAGNGTETVANDTPNGKIATLVPHDFNFERPFSVRDLLKAIEAIKAHHKLVIVDACHATSGLVGNTASGPAQDPAAPVVTFFGACRGDQTSSENSSGGVFTQALVRSLAQVGEGGNGSRWMRELFVNVKAQIEVSEFSQTPQLLALSGTGEVAWVPATR